MVFRHSAVQVRLERLEEVVTELARLQRLDREALLESLSQMWAVERGLQLGAEIIFDIGNHVLNAQHGVSPTDYKDIVRQLARRGILSKELGIRLEGLAGFRNILVHDYIHLDPEKVLEAFDRAPKDFSDFALEIRNWLEGLASQP